MARLGTYDAQFDVLISSCWGNAQLVPGFMGIRIKSVKTPRKTRG